MKLNDYVEASDGRTGWVCEVEAKSERVRVWYETGGASGWLDVRGVKQLHTGETATDRDRLTAHLLEFVASYGPWVALYVVTETLREPFKKLADEEAGKRTRTRPRAKNGEDLGGKKA